MTRRQSSHARRRVAALAVAVAALALPPADAVAQSGGAGRGFAEAEAEVNGNGSAWLEPGVPNISGAWERFRGRQGDPGVPPPESTPPLKPEHLASWERRQAESRAADARGEPLATGYTFCLPDGMPSMMSGPFPFEFLQSPGQVTVVQEAYNQIRRIYLDKPQSDLDDLEPGFYGRSVGRWEDGALVVDTIGIKDYVRFRDVPHTPGLRITERIWLVAPDILWDEITIEDPGVLETPWTFTFAYRRMPDYEILEYVCEDNREYADEDGVTRLRLGGGTP
jgi:hypothetical protein